MRAKNYERLNLKKRGYVINSLNILHLLPTHKKKTPLWWFRNNFTELLGSVWRGGGLSWNEVFAPAHFNVTEVGRVFRDTLYIMIARTTD